MSARSFFVDALIEDMHFSGGFGEGKSGCRIQRFLPHEGLFHGIQLQRTYYRAREGPGIGRRDEEAVSAFLDYLGDPSDARGHNRNAGGQRLNNRQGKSFGQRRQQKTRPTLGLFSGANGGESESRGR